VVAIAVVLVSVRPNALADGSRVDGARRAYDELRFGDVLPAIAAARRDGPLGRNDDIELTRLEAYTYAVFEDSAHAVDAFRRLLALDPTFEPRGVSPKIRRYFDEARRPRAASVTALPPQPPPPPPPHRSWVRSPWVWGGAVAVAAVAGAGLWWTLRGDGERAGNLGSLVLP
jgi:hypothetical protein